MIQRIAEFNDKRALVINATNLGSSLDGIGVYALNLLRELSRLKSDLHITVYVNRAAREHLAAIEFPSHWSIRW